MSPVCCAMICCFVHSPPHFKTALGQADQVLRLDPRSSSDPAGCCPSQSGCVLLLCPSQSGCVFLLCPSQSGVSSCCVLPSRGVSSCCDLPSPRTASMSSGSLLVAPLLSRCTCWVGCWEPLEPGRSREITHAESVEQSTVSPRLRCPFRLLLKAISGQIKTVKDCLCV